MSLVFKVTEQNTKLENHPTKDLGRDLCVSFEGLKLEIIDIDRVYEPMLYKNRHLYPRVLDMGYSQHSPATHGFPGEPPGVGLWAHWTIVRHYGQNVLWHIEKNKIIYN